MSRRRKRARPPTVEEQIRARVSDLLTVSNITPMLVYDLLLLGHRMYRSGMGIPTEQVWRAIAGAFADCDRYYLTPGQTAQLFDQELLKPKDLEYLNQ